MSKSFSDLKKSRDTSLKTLQSAVDKLAPQQYKDDDERYWYPEVDKSGNGFAVIRFLPASKNEDVPFVRIWDHAFKGPTGQWYIEKSLSTLGQPDPVMEHNSRLWDSGSDENKKIASKQKRRLTYISNVLVIRDPAKPENEGTVRLYRYGKKIFDKLKDKMNPTFPGETPMDPFDMWAGANLRLKITNVDGYRNYDKSEFEPASALMEGDDAKLDELWNKQHSLAELISTDKFKSYDDLKARLNRVLALDAEPVRPARSLPKVAPPADEDPSEVEEIEDDVDVKDFFKRVAG